MAQDLWPAHYQTFSIIFLKEFIKLKVNLDMMIKNLKHVDISININIINCDYFLEYTNFKDNLIEYKCLCCNKNYQHKFDEMTKERLFNTSKFSNHDNNKFILLSRKDVYPYEYMDHWKRFNENHYLKKKKKFYSHLNIQDITDAD